MGGEVRRFYRTTSGPCDGARIWWSLDGLEGLARGCYYCQNGDCVRERGGQVRCNIAGMLALNIAERAAMKAVGLK